MYALFVLSMFLQISTAHASKRKVLFPTLKARGVKTHEARAIGTSLCNAIDRLRVYKLTCADDLKAMIKWNARASQLNACKDDNCFATAAEAMKAEFVITGSYSKVDDIYVLALGLLSVKDSAIEKRVELKTKSSSHMLKQLDQAAKQLVTEPK
ncbi:MAG: hypothetical protein VYC39_11430 [Myxococcota bacterium]|nr:hypothetical protein [Myxococcota bacterium]